jgi:hypothetical protein
MISPLPAKCFGQLPLEGSGAAAIQGMHEMKGLPKKRAKTAGQTLPGLPCSSGVTLGSGLATGASRDLAGYGMTAR